MAFPTVSFGYIEGFLYCMSLTYRDPILLRNKFTDIQHLLEKVTLGFYWNGCKENMSEVSLSYENGALHLVVRIY